MPPAKMKDRRRISWGKVKEKINVTLSIEFEEPSPASRDANRPLEFGSERVDLRTFTQRF